MAFYIESGCALHEYEDLDSALRDFCAHEHLGARLYFINDAGEKEYWFWDFWHRYGCFQTACFDADGLFPSDYQQVNCESDLDNGCKDEPRGADFPCFESGSEQDCQEIPF